MGDILLIIIEQFLLHVPLLLGSYISLSLMKVPDLSLESAFVCGAMTGALVLSGHSSSSTFMQLILVIGASLAGGALVGLTSSSITQFGRLPHLLASIITFGIFYGVNQLGAGSYISLSNYPNPLIIESIPRHPELLALLGAGALCSLILYGVFRKQLGYALAFYGNNPHFFVHYGISVRYLFIMGIVLANSLAGLSGYLVAQSNGFADITMGFGKILLCITALILGKSILKDQKPPSLLVPLIGGTAYFSLQQALIKTGFNIKYFSTVQSCVVLVILLLLVRKQGKTTNHLGV